MNLGNKIKELRKTKKMLQSDLAQKSGISRVAIGNYERGERQPNVEILTKIATALNVPVNDLLSYEEERNTEKLKDIDTLLEKFPHHKEKILDMFNHVYKTIEAEYYKPSAIKTNDTIMQTLDFNIELYYELFLAIRTLSNDNPFIMDYIRNKNFVDLYALKDRKLSEINETINKISNNYLVRYGVDDVKPQDVTANIEGK